MAEGTAVRLIAEQVSAEILAADMSSTLRGQDAQVDARLALGDESTRNRHSPPMRIGAIERWRHRSDVSNESSGSRCMSSGWQKKWRHLGGADGLLAECSVHGMSERSVRGSNLWFDAIVNWSELGAHDEE